MLIDSKMNPFISRQKQTGAAMTPEEARAPAGIMIDTPAAPVIQDDPSMVEQGVGLLKDKATGAASTMAENAIDKAVAGGKGGAAAGAAGSTGTGLMAAAAPMAAPLMIGGLLATKLFK